MKTGKPPIRATLALQSHRIYLLNRLRRTVMPNLSKATDLHGKYKYRDLKSGTADKTVPP